jgi:hypothetical protein
VVVMMMITLFYLFMCLPNSLEVNYKIAWAKMYTKKQIQTKTKHCNLGHLDNNKN